MKSKGPKMEPCGTPQSTRWVSIKDNILSSSGKITKLSSSGKITKLSKLYLGPYDSTLKPQTYLLRTHING